jgi:hypothetical protein
VTQRHDHALENQCALRDQPAGALGVRTREQCRARSDRGTKRLASECRGRDLDMRIVAEPLAFSRAFIGTERSPAVADRNRDWRWSARPSRRNVFGSAFLWRARDAKGPGIAPKRRPSFRVANPKQRLGRDHPFHFLHDLAQMKRL